jgi:F0F1-type ATP synthase membrane subunit b/b'
MEGTLFTLLFTLTLFFVLTQLVLFGAFMKAMGEFKKSHNVDEEALKRSKHKSTEILQDALKKANEILSKAQKEGVEVLASEEKTGKNLIEDYKKHLAEIERNLADALSHTIAAADDSYHEFAEEVGRKVESHLAENEKTLAERADKVVIEAEKTLTEVTSSVQKLVKTEVEHELESVHKEVDEYRRQRMRIIDERIIDMLEEVIKVTLEKKLSLAEQSELVYKALEEAKREGAFK